MIYHRDLRSASNYVSHSQGHKQEICGLKYSPDETQLASGGNDNKLMIWNIGAPKNAEAKFSSHCAAVKALAFSPHKRGLLASGGGTADKTIKLWDTISH